MSTSSPVDLFWSICVVAGALDHDHTDECADDSEENEDEDDGYLDCPFARREEIVQRMILVYKGLRTISFHSRAESGGGLRPFRGPIGCSK
jgi:hypothetical protein